MNDFQFRVVDEKNDLDTKLDKLGDFIRGAVFKSLPIDEQFRLAAQQRTMRKYSQILGERIAAFTV